MLKLLYVTVNGISVVEILLDTAGIIDKISFFTWSTFPSVPTSTILDFWITATVRISSSFIFLTWSARFSK